MSDATFQGLAVVDSGTKGASGANPTIDRAGLDRSLARGVAWTGAAKWGSQVVGWASTLVVARLLTPADYAIVGYATAYLGLVNLLSEFGIGSAIVALRGLGGAELAQMNTVAVLFGGLTFLVSCAVAPLLARFFNSEPLTLVVIAMASTFLITGIRVAPMALLQRELRFRDLAINDAVQALTLAVGAVTFALLGFGYWTLVLSAILGAMLSTLGVLRLAPLAFRWPNWGAIAPAVRFSGETVMARLSWYFYQNADFVVAGKVLGDTSAGAYRLAWDFASAPVEKTTSMVTRVTTAVLSAAQADQAALRHLVLRITTALSFVTLPATLGLALIAPDLVPLALGEKWREMVAPLQILAVAAAVRSLAPIFPQVLSVTRHNRQTMMINVVGACVMPVAFWWASRWGADGIATVWVTLYPVVLVVPLAWLAFRAIALSGREYLGALFAPATSALLMAVSVFAFQELHGDAWGPALRVAADVVVGALTYAAALFFLHRGRTMAAIAAVRSLRS
jgi:PST family polysaccharide transporter